MKINVYDITSFDDNTPIDTLFISRINGELTYLSTILGKRFSIFKNYKKEIKKWIKDTVER